MPLSFKHIAPFIHSAGNRHSKWLSYAGLTLGVFLLLCSVQLYININQLLKDRSPRKNGYDFISVTKVVTNDNMGTDNRFTGANVLELTQQPFIDGAAPLKANLFRVTAGAGDVIPFSTDIFLESLQTDFLDTVPANFSWQEGQADVPIIFSTDFLEMYNVFAPSWDLPQLSQQTAGSISIFLRCTGNAGAQQFKARIVAFSDRVNSVLVPDSFLSWANKNIEGKQSDAASRVFIKTRDANNPDLLSFLQQKNYHVNKDKTKFGRIKQVLQGIVSGLAGFGVLVILLAMVLFSFYLQLMIARSKDNLQLLMTLGYSPKWLTKTVSQKWIPVYAGIFIAALLLTIAVQWLFKNVGMNGRDELSGIIHWVIPVMAIALFGVTVWVNHRLVKQQLQKI